MDRTRFVDHRGKRILLLDFSRVRDPAETLAAIGEARQVVKLHPPRSLLVLTSTREGRYNAESIRQELGEPFAVVGAQLEKREEPAFEFVEL